MDNMNLTNYEKKKSIFTVKNIVRLLESLLIIFVFCPSFLVSCSGEDINVNVMTAVGGVSSYGEKIVDPHPGMLLCLFIPIAILVITFIKKMGDNKVALITLICSFVDFIIWLIFKSSVKKIAKENYCSFKTTGVFVFTIIILFIVMILSLLVIIKKIQLESDLLVVFTGGGTKEAINQMSNAVTQMSSAVSQMAGNNIISSGESVVGYCDNCGSAITKDSKFCASCGAPVQRELNVGPNANENGENSQIVFCQECGAKLAIDSLFCDSCGAKVEKKE